MSIEPPSSHPREISVTEPVGAAYNRVKLMLFQPFDLGKWFVIGFCAWLAGLGESGSYGGNYSGHNFNGGRAQPLEQLRHAYFQAHDYTMANLSWLIPVAGLVAILVLGLGILFLWLNSRGKFMFLHCVALNKAEVEIPWDKYAGVANSLFWFRLVLSFIGLAFFLPAIIILGVLVVRMLLAGQFDFIRLFPILGLVLGVVALGVVLGMIQKALADFIVPILYLRGGGCLAAWGEFGRLLADNPGRFVLYILFQIVLASALASIVIIVFLATCCVACCFAMLPYIGTVLLLPIAIFKRSYSLYFLAQFGPHYDVFPPALPAATAPPPPGLRPL